MYAYSSRRCTSTQIIESRACFAHCSVSSSFSIKLIVPGRCRCGLVLIAKQLHAYVVVSDQIELVHILILCTM